MNDESHWVMLSVDMMTEEMWQRWTSSCQLAARLWWSPTTVVYQHHRTEGIVLPGMAHSTTSLLCDNYAASWSKGVLIDPTTRWSVSHDTVRDKTCLGSWPGSLCHQSLDQHYIMWRFHVLGTAWSAVMWRLDWYKRPIFPYTLLLSRSHLPSSLRSSAYSFPHKYVSSARCCACYHGHTQCLALLCVTRCAILLPFISLSVCILVLVVYVYLGSGG